MAQPTQLNFKATERVLRYLKGSLGKVLFFPRDSPIQLLAFSDANWGGYVGIRRSVIGYYFFLGHSLVNLGK